MNANELADIGVEIANDKQIAAMSVDELIEYLNGWYSTAAPRKAAIMLRQQQAEKAEQKQEIDSLYYENSMLKNRHNLQQAEIESLKSKLAQADRVYDFDNPLLNSDDVGFKQIELNAELLRKAQKK